MHSILEDHSLTSIDHSMHVTAKDDVIHGVTYRVREPSLDSLFTFFFNCLAMNSIQ